MAAVLEHYADPLRALARAEIPAVVLRGAYPADQGAGLIARFQQRGLMDSRHLDPDSVQPRRVDIGTSLSNRAGDKEAFLAHAGQTHALFAELFVGRSDPVRLVYHSLEQLAGGRRVVTAHEPDGRQYGPAIFRIHYQGHRYPPHTDHVALHEKRVDYAVSRFSHQFAGVLCLQNSHHEGRSVQSVLHRCLWTPEVDPHLASDSFSAYAAANAIPSYQVDLDPGDLYFFNTRLIHEVPALDGTDPRVVLAVFIGYSEDDPEVFVWS